MPYPIITPVFFSEFVNTEEPEKSTAKYQVLTTPSAIEYVFPLAQEAVVRRLMQQKDIMAYKMISMSPEAEEEYIKKSQETVANMPLLKHYWQLKTLTMNLLQDRRYTLDQRMWFLNYVYRTIQGIIETPDPRSEGKTDEEKAQICDRNIAGFIQSVLRAEDHDNIIKYFGEIQPNYAYSVVEGLSFLNALLPKDGKTEAPEQVKKLVAVAFKHAGVEKGNESQFKFDPDLHLAIKKEFNEMFGYDPKRTSTGEIDRSCYLEQIMVNYVWTYCFPFADLNLDVWQNFIFMNSLYNIIKVTVSCYLYGTKTPDEDFVFAVTTLDGALRAINVNIARFLVDTNAKAGCSNNGDMAILSIS